MTLRHMKIFLAVCEHDNNVTRAAQSLYLAQPAVSLAIKELENYYGVRLFDRASRKLMITEAGKRFRDYAVHIAGMFDDMEKGLKDWDYHGILRVGASITIGSQFMPSYVEAFYAACPEMDVRVFITSTETLEEKLLRNELDIALTEGLVHNGGLVAEEYMEDSLAAVCSARGPFAQGELVPAREFGKQRFLLRESGSGTREEFDRTAQAAGLCVVPVWEATSTTALVNAVIHGLGVAVLPRRMIQGPLERGLIHTFQVNGIEFQRHFRLVYHKNKFLTGSARAFMELCRNYEMDYPIPRYNGL